MTDLATPVASPSAPPAPTSIRAGDLLRVSRAGLIVSHLWCYLAPAVAAPTVWGWNFWVGLAYITVPLGLLIYGWNDYFDWDVDRLSPRKNSAGTSLFFGPRLRRKQLASLPYYILAFQLPFALFWAFTGHPWLVGWLALMAFGNMLYNGPGLRLSRVPVFAELTATGIYMLIFWLGVLVHSPGAPAWLWVFTAAAVLNFQVLGTLVDVAEDAQVGKRTLSVAFGRTVSLLSVHAFWLLKAGLTFYFTGNLLATGVALLGNVLVASGFSLGGFRRSSFAYSSSIFIDWLWLAVMFLD